MPPNSTNTGFISRTFGRSVLGHIDSCHLELDLSVHGDQVGLTDSWFRMLWLQPQPLLRARLEQKQRSSVGKEPQLTQEELRTNNQINTNWNLARMETMDGTGKTNTKGQHKPSGGAIDKDPLTIQISITDETALTEQLSGLSLPPEHWRLMFSILCTWWWLH